MTISIRNVDKKLFEQFKIHAQKKGLPIGEAANEAMKEWMLHQKRRKGKLAFKPLPVGKGSRASEEVDEILYGSS